MKWYNALWILLGFAGITQFYKWILDSVNITTSVGEITSFFLSSILSFLTIIILILSQQNREIDQMKLFLSKKGFKNKEDFIEKMFKNKKKKGAIDPRILWIILALIILYLLWKSGFFSFLG